MKRPKNTFALESDAYALARPRYPGELYQWILANCTNRGLVWDCATGNGQAAIDLSPHFKTIYASDISPEQVEHGLRSPNIIYSVQPAEATGYADGLFDLVTVAQALHWFSYQEYWKEVIRVSKEASLFCAWGYAWFTCDPDLEQQLVRPFRKIVQPFWAPNNRILWDGYQDKDIKFPFQRLTTPEFSMDVTWTIPQLVAYMQTWSSYKRSQQNKAAAHELTSLVDHAFKIFPTDVATEIHMPLVVVAGRVASE